MTAMWTCDWRPDDLNPGPECPYCEGQMCARFDGLGCTHNREERHGYGESSMTCITHGEPTCCEVCCERPGEPGHAPLSHVHQMFCERCNDVVEWPSGDGLVAVRRGSGGVFPDGLTNHPPLTFPSLPPPDLALMDDNGVTPFRESVTNALLRVFGLFVAVITPGGGGVGGRGASGPPPPPPRDKG